MPTDLSNDPFQSVQPHTIHSRCQFCDGDISIPINLFGMLPSTWWIQCQLFRFYNLDAMTLSGHRSTSHTHQISVFFKRNAFFFCFVIQCKQNNLLNQICVCFCFVFFPRVNYALKWCIVSRNRIYTYTKKKSNGKMRKRHTKRFVSNRKTRIDNEVEIICLKLHENINMKVAQIKNKI